MTLEDLDEIEATLDPTARMVIAFLREHNTQLCKQLDASTEQSRLLVEQLAKLTEQVQDLKQRLYGKRSEKLQTVGEQLRRRVDPDELTVDGTPMPTEPVARAKEKRRKARKAGQAERERKRALRKNIPVVLEQKTVTPSQLPEGYTLDDFRKLGDGKTVQRVEHVREHLIIERFVLETLISIDGTQIVTAEAPPGVVDGGHYGPGLHAHVAVSRCDDIMPLYGSERALERAGYPIARSTLCTLFHRTAEQLSAIYEELRRVVRKGRYVHADETGQRVLDKEQCHRGWMWVILSQQAVVYHYSDGRDSNTARELLGGTSGNLTIDGYAGYNCLSDKDARRSRSGCWGHARRKWLEAIPQGMKEHENREVLELIGDLYQVEHDAIERGIEGTGEHLELRQSRSKLIVKKIWRWVDARVGKHSPDTKMGKAIKYATKQRDKLEKFLSDPKLKLDNNRAERALRIVAILVSLCASSSSTRNLKGSVVLRNATRASCEFASVA